MPRWLSIGLALVAAVLGWQMTSAAWAGTYSWQLPTGSAPGKSNPDHDSYGATPWSYLDAASASSTGPPPLAPSSFQSLGTFSTAIDGGLTGWQDTGDNDQPFVAVNRGATAVSGSSGLQIPPGQLALQPAGDRVVAVGWTSPLSSPEGVTISGTFQPDSSSPTCPSQPTWVIEQDGSMLASEPPTSPTTPSGPQTFSTTTTVAPGDTIYFVLGWYGVPAAYNPACTTAGLTLALQAQANPPAVTLDSPASGATIEQAQPTFSGTSSTGFGQSSTVAVRIWRGSVNSGTPVEILTPDASKGTFSASPQPPLTSGTYTAQAEQDDRAGDAGLSRPVTFTVHNVAPSVTLAPLATRPLLSSTPVLKGTGATARGDSSSVLVDVWSGSSAQGKPIRSLRAILGRDGRWSAQVSPPLSDGRYTAVAVQSGGGDIYGVSRPQTFRVKVHPPAVELLQPRAGEAVKFGPVTFSGKAGTTLGDASTVTLEIFAGRNRGGNRVASFALPAGAGTWTRRVDGLTPGTYAAVVLQRDDAGHLASSRHVFKLLRPPQVIAAPPTLEPSNQARIAIMCTAASGECAGDVLVATQRTMRPTPDGPSGRVRVLFAYLTASAGRTVVVEHSVPDYVATALRRASPVRVVVSVKLKDSAGPAIAVSALAVLRLGR